MDKFKFPEIHTIKKLSHNLLIKFYLLIFAPHKVPKVAISNIKQPLRPINQGLYGKPQKFFLFVSKLFV